MTYGEVLQKFVNYQTKVAIYGDYTKYTSKPLKDFMYESNKGNNIFFCSNKRGSDRKACKQLIRLSFFENNLCSRCVYKWYIRKREVLYESGICVLFGDR